MLSKLALLATVPFVLAAETGDVQYKKGANGNGKKALSSRPLTAEEQAYVDSTSAALAALLYDMSITVAEIEAIGYTGGDETVVGLVKGQVVQGASVQAATVQASGAVSAASVAAGSVSVSGDSTVDGASHTKTLKVSGSADFRTDVEVNGNILLNGLLYGPGLFTQVLEVKQLATLGAASVGKDFTDGISIEAWGKYASDKGNAVVVHGNIEVTGTGGVSVAHGTIATNMLVANDVTGNYINGKNGGTFNALVTANKGLTVKVVSNQALRVEGDSSGHAFLTLYKTNLRYDVSGGSDLIQQGHSHPYKPVYHNSGTLQMLAGVNFDTSSTNVDEGAVITVINASLYGIVFGSTVNSDPISTDFQSQTQHPFSLNENGTGIQNMFNDALIVQTANSVVDLVFYKSKWYCKGCTIVSQIPEQWDLGYIHTLGMPVLQAGGR